ncbi:MAG TPA: hypothetical protein VFO32_00245 [Sphingomicrobium sp.]|nr:hypothetical protein [Sphingomicrobium sp.]
MAASAKSVGGMALLYSIRKVLSAAEAEFKRVGFASFLCDGIERHFAVG